MEMQIIYDIIKKLKQSNCWDIQSYNTIFKNILYFNQMLRTRQFYFFEILFLLQNDYIFSEKQIVKYFKIRKDIINRNPQIDLSTLEVIQFKFKGDNQVRYGYSAQEVQKLCGDLVVGTNPMTVNYSDVHTLKILQLEQRIKELEKRLGL
jgi:hypothetical protein